MQGSVTGQVVSRFDEQTGERVFVYQGDPREFYESCSMIVGDAVHNYRSSLDHLAWSLVEVNGNNPTRNTAFPICDSLEDFNKAIARKMLSGMPEQAKEMIKDVQTFYQAELFRDNLPERLETVDKCWLLLLGHLDNTDKHRQLYLTLPEAIGGRFPTGLVIESSEQGDYSTHYGPVSDGTELARLGMQYQDVNFIPAFDIAFGLGQGVSKANPVEEVSRKVLEGKAVWQVLDSIDRHVKKILDDFDQVFFTDNTVAPKS